VPSATKASMASPGFTGNRSDSMNSPPFEAKYWHLVVGGLVLVMGMALAVAVVGSVLADHVDKWGPG
jgi:ABC-type Fe3+ transport system permease subunit